MEGFVTAIGWAVIIYFLIYIGGSIAESSNNQKRKKAEDHINKINTAYRVMARDIYYQTRDKAVKEKVKLYAQQYLGGWALLELDMPDSEYCAKYSTYEAEAEIERRGPPLIVKDGELESLW